jgi:hypothetical protein
MSVAQAIGISDCNHQAQVNECDVVEQLSNQPVDRALPRIFAPGAVQK